MNETVKFKFTTGEDNIAYACPLETAENDGRVALDNLDDCVEADVVGRYSGGIDIVNR